MTDTMSATRPEGAGRACERSGVTSPAGFRAAGVSCGIKPANGLDLALVVSEAPAARELDMLLTAGERISISLLCMAILDRGMPAVSFTGSQAGIVTDTSHGRAKIVEVRADRLRDALGAGSVAVVAGFQGMSTSRDITTLGRGGSDTTAVALAVDHCFGPVGLHRIEINSRPENTRSLRVVEKLGFRDEGLRERLLHIDGAWRDHVGYALTSEDVAAEGGLLARWHRVRTAARPS